MDWLVDRVFPFRRLTVWLGLLLLIVIVLALALTALLVLPTLDEEPGAAAFPPPAAAEQIALMPAEPAHVHPSTPQQGPLQRRTSAPY